MTPEETADRASAVVATLLPTLKVGNWVWYNNGQQGRVIRVTPATALVLPMGGASAKVVPIARITRVGTTFAELVAHLREGVR